MRLKPCPEGFFCCGPAEQWAIEVQCTVLSQCSAVRKVVPERWCCLKRQPPEAKRDGSSSFGFSKERVHTGAAPLS